MATFEVKYRAGSQIRSETITATDEMAAGKAFSSTHEEVSNADVISVVAVGRYVRKYHAANFVCALISFVGWTGFLLGALALLASLYTLLLLFEKPQDFEPMRQVIMAIATAGVPFSILLLLMGVLMAAFGQHLRATTDAANHLGEMLALMKVSKA